jgi:hypothetical protein
MGWIKLDDILQIVTITQTGLILNFIGTVLVACAFGANLGGAYQEDDKGRRIYLASFLRPRMFWLGLALLGAGFLLQLVP